MMSKSVKQPEVVSVGVMVVGLGCVMSLSQPSGAGGEASAETTTA